MTVCSSAQSAITFGLAGALFFASVLIKSRTAYGLTCQEILSMVDAGVPESIIAGTIQEASPAPSQADYQCLLAVSTVPQKILTTAASVVGVELAPATSTASVAVRAVGMDDEHSIEAESHGDDFLTTLEYYRRDYCTSLVEAQYDVNVEYYPGTQRTDVHVRLVGMPSFPMRLYPGGRYLTISCLSMVASSAFRTWRPSGVVVHEVLDGATLSFAYYHTSNGSIPAALLVTTGDEQFEVKLFKQSSATIVFEFPSTLPDGNKNGTARLRDIIGEDMSLPGR